MRSVPDGSAPDSPNAGAVVQCRQVRERRPTRMSRGTGFGRIGDEKRVPFVGAAKVLIGGIIRPQGRRRPAFRLRAGRGGGRARRLQDLPVAGALHQLRLDVARRHLVRERRGAASAFRLPRLRGPERRHPRSFRGAEGRREALNARDRTRPASRASIRSHIDGERLGGLVRIVAVSGDLRFTSIICRMVDEFEMCLSQHWSLTAGFIPQSRQARKVR